MNMFNVDDRVVLPEASELEFWNPEEDDCTRGVVTQINDDGKITVKWDSSWRNPNPSNHDVEDLMLESEADDILSKLEEEYEAWADPIRKKMEQVGKLLREANELAYAQDQNLTEMHDIVQPLMSAMSSAGWSTSSLRC